MTNTAILFTTHVVHDSIRRQILKLRDETRGQGDFYVGYQADKVSLQLPDGVTPFPFTLRKLNLLGYSPRVCTLLGGSFHFVLLDFFRHFPGYDYYWLVEYDVRFNGNWKDFFSFFEDKEEDFVSAHLETVDDFPGWSWWDAVELAGIPLKRENLRKSFNPICRLSWRALDLLDRRCQLGDRGHYEAVMPTLFHHYRLRMADFGGRGRYAYPGCPDLFYADNPGDDGPDRCTHRFRPAYTEEGMTLPNKIYHPIK